jgi:hypothetical protein
MTNKRSATISPDLILDDLLGNVEQQDDERKSNRDPE